MSNKYVHIESILSSAEQPPTFLPKGGRYTLHSNTVRQSNHKRMTGISIYLVFVSCFIWKVESSSRSVSSLSHPLAFAPCPPPRFDVFSETLIGSWTPHSTTGDEETRTVEEVMRSCGGAVQGLREPNFFGGGNDNNGMYLNRANDGFVYMDDGSYSFGPTQWSSDEEADDDDDNNDNSNDGFFLSNIQLGKSSRLLVLSSSSSSSSNNESMILQKPVGSSGGDLTTSLSSSIQVKTIEVDDDPALLFALPVHFHKIMQCSMAASGQQQQQPPWNLQRAKWECQTFEKKSSSEDDYDGAFVLPPFSESIQLWVSKQQPSASSSDSLARWVSTGKEDSSSSSSQDEEGTNNIFHMGAICETTGSVKAVARHFHPTTNTLSKVMFLEGTML